MNVVEHAEREKNRLIHFCRNHNRVYIYGAGRLGKRYYNILLHYGFILGGFIVTDGGIKEYCGLPVYAVEDIAGWVTERDGIIAAYSGSSVEEVGRNFCFAQPDILSLDHRTLLYMEYEIYFIPIVKELKEKFPVSAFENEHSWAKWKELLIVRLDAIGDLICTTAFIRELKRNYPEAAVTMVIRKQNEALLKNCPYIDRLILYDSELSNAGFLEGCRNFGAIKEKVSEFAHRYFQGTHFDAVFLPREALCGSISMDELLVAAYSKAEYRIGHYVVYDNEWIYDMVQEIFSSILYQTKPMHEALYSLDMLKAGKLKVENDKLELWLDHSARMKANNILRQSNVKDGDKLIAVGLIGSLPAKSWKVENYNKLISMFYEKYGSSYKFIIFGGNDAVAAAERLIRDTKTVVDLTGKLPLDVTAACIERCDMYVGSDTGLMHMATAADKPSVTLYRVLDDATDMCWVGPCKWGARRKDSIAMLPPSGLDGCQVVCRKNYSHCINLITPYQVAQAVEAVMDKKCDEGKTIE